MFFRAQNLGPLRDAEIDLSKDLIVLAGPNNSGKTYMAWSIYGLHRFRATLRTTLERWVRQLLESPEHAIDLGDTLSREGPDLLKSVAAEYRSSLHLCFAAESAPFVNADVSLRAGDVLLDVRMPSLNALRTRISEGSYSTLWVSGSGSMWVDQAGRWDVDPAHPRWVSGSGSMRLDWAILDDLNTPMVRGKPVSAELRAASTSRLSSLPEDARELLRKNILLNLNHMVTSELFPRCSLFPPERIAVDIFAKELALKRTELVDEIVDADLGDRAVDPMDLVRRKAGRYPWPIRDSLRVANDLLNHSKGKMTFAFLADELESAILGGKISISDTGDMLFLPRGTDRHLQMHLTSSVVKSLASLVFYFRHLAVPGDFIIIDEPELNLHPDNQRKVTQILAKAVRLGFKVMLSTHSDYVVRELDHLVMLSKLSPGEAKELEYDPAWALQPTQVGVYLFDHESAHSVEVGETGFSVETIDAEINRMQETSQRFYAKLSR